MHRLETAILQLFQSNPQQEYATTDLVRELFPAEEMPYAAGKEDQLKAKRRKAQLHRKLLYHLNKLVEDGILKTTKVQAKGEKCFALSLEEGELIVGKRNKKIIITKPAGNKSPIEGYAAQQIIKRFGRDQWATQVNSLLLRAQEFNSLEELQATIMETFVNVNDVVGVDGFERLAERSTRKEVQAFLKQIDADTANYDNRLSLLIGVDQIKDPAGISDFLEAYALLHPKKVDVIFNLDKKALHSHARLFEEIADLFSAHTIKIYIKNNALAKAPFMVGDTGVYNFEEDDWAYHQAEFPHAKGVACSQAAIVIDHKRFAQHYQTPAEFRKLLLTVLKALVLVNLEQQRKATSYLRHILDLNKEQPKQPFSIARNFIRFWNYDVETDTSSTLDLLKSCKEITEDFCSTQETIFKSVGMPGRFRVGFSSAFKKFDPNLTDRVYMKATITRIEDLFTTEMKRVLGIREDLFEIFEGADRVRIFRGGNLQPTDMVREISTILTSFVFPFFCYDFAGLSGSIKLTQFFS